MGEHSKIEWTDHTFNPWIGCAKVSEGCAHCYAEALAKRTGMAKWGNAPRVRTSPGNWRLPLKWNAQAEKDGTRPRVFCASLADVFEVRPELDAWRGDLWNLIEATPRLVWLLLTKRPENAARCLPHERLGEWPENVWLGTSVESQDVAGSRIGALVESGCNRRFLSVEPLLGPLDLRLWLPVVDWVIVGGESGPGARPMRPDWVRSLRDQCRAELAPFFFKQWGEYDAEGRRVGKKAAGRVLDGRTWNELPETIGKR